MPCCQSVMSDKKELLFGCRPCRALLGGIALTNSSSVSIKLIGGRLGLHALSRLDSCFDPIRHYLTLGDVQLLLLQYREQ